MSSFRCQRNTPHKRPRENENFKSHCPNRNCVPGLLRLDSTGEVTSAGQVSNCQNPTVEKQVLNNKKLNKCRTNSYKNLVENLTMGTLINSASACLGSAKSYIGSFCPYKTSRGLVRSKRESSSVDYLQNMLDTNNHSKFDNSDHQSIPSITPEYSCKNCNSAETIMNQETDKSSNWTGNIFGAIQSSLLSNCSKMSDIKMQDVGKYVPPQRRCAGSKTNNLTASVDPKLTPYNARLLEKSKQSHAHANGYRKCPEAYSPRVYKKKFGNPKQDLNTECGEKVDKCKQAEEEPHQTELHHIIPETLESSQVATDDIKTVCSDNETDWFEYECDSAKCIPIPVEKIKIATQKCATDDGSQGSESDSKIQQLHSWLSIENSNEDVSCIECTTATDESSPVKNNAKACDKALNCLQEARTPSVDKQSENLVSDGYTEVKNSQDNQYNRKQDSSSEYESKDHSRTEKEHSVSDNDHISVLYVRSLGKKRRPSAKKRRRQKAQQNESNEQTVTSSDKSSSDKRSSCVSQPSSAVAFILGYDNDSSKNTLPSFHVACDMDWGSDWTESDCESDENFSSLEDENLFENQLGFQCNDLLRNMHFTLTCTMQPTDTSAQTSSSSAIDDINMSWRVQVSVEPESRKNKSSKKVHFPDDNDLATIHPIVAWSYAYQAARKGPWEQYARDRGRFLRRITDAEKVLETVLNQNHRDKIFRERFCVNFME